MSVTALGSYSRQVDAEEASRDDRGQRVSVWYVPRSGGPGSLSPPDWERNLFAAVWTTAMAAIGWLGAAALALRAWRKLRRRPPEARSASSNS
ncbi:MAG: hypothetical protein J5I93_18285 [Pirellulaceae bacterium]|nr:hypothetical protein [Pirellulaceae bacterium]